MDTSEIIFNLCFGAVSAIVIDRLLPDSLFLKHKSDDKHPSPSSGSPLHSWISSVDQKTSHEVRDIVSAGFEMARKTPKKRRQKALREATFQAPYEVATVIPGAGPDSRLEDMGPMPSIMEEWAVIRDPGLLHAFDITREGRVFLYFPDGTSKATAAFVAINAEIFPPEWTIVERFAVKEFSEDQESLVTSAVCAWVKRYMTWEDEHPQIIDRIEKGKLPVIFNFRELASSALYDTEANKFLDQSAGRLANLMKP